MLVIQPDEPPCFRSSGRSILWKNLQAARSCWNYAECRTKKQKRESVESHKKNLHNKSLKSKLVKMLCF